MFERSIELNGEHFTTAYNLGMLEARAGRRERAAECFSAAVALAHTAADAEDARRMLAFLVAAVGNARGGAATRA